MDTHFRGCRCPLRHAKTSSPSLTRARILLRTATRPATRTCICFRRSVLASWVFLHLHSPFSPLFHYWFSVFSWSFISPYFPLLSLSIAACLLIWFSCTNTACLSSSRTLSPTPTLPHPCCHQGLSIRQKYLYALTLHNRRSPSYCDGHAGFCV